MCDRIKVFELLDLPLGLYLNIVMTLTPNWTCPYYYGPQSILSLTKNDLTTIISTGHISRPVLRPPSCVRPPSQLRLRRPPWGALRVHPSPPLPPSSACARTSAAYVRGRVSVRAHMRARTDRRALAARAGSQRVYVALSLMRASERKER